MDDPDREVLKDISKQLERIADGLGPTADEFKYKEAAHALALRTAQGDTVAMLDSLVKMRNERDEALTRIDSHAKHLVDKYEADLSAERAAHVETEVERNELRLSLKIMSELTTSVYSATKARAEKAEVECDDLRRAMAITFESKAYIDLMDERDGLVEAMTARALLVPEVCAHNRAIPTKPRSDDTAVHYIQWCPDCGAIYLYENRRRSPEAERVVGWFPPGHPRFTEET